MQNSRQDTTNSDAKNPSVVLINTVEHITKLVAVKLTSDSKDWSPRPSNFQGSSRIQDMDIVAPNQLDERRIEVLADGLLLFHGAQVAVDTTLVSALRRDGTPRPRCADVDGLPVEGRSSVTQSSPGDRGERDWLSWRPKWEEGGHRRRRTSCSNWPKQRSAMSRRS